MKDLEAAKKLIKRSKKHPDWYSKDEVKYAKIAKKRLKKMKKNAKKRQSEDKSK